MKKSSYRFPLYLAGAFLLWSLFVTLLSFGGDFWPIFLYAPTWPVSIAIESSVKAITHSLAPDYKVAADSIFTVMDRVSRGLYVVLGTAWYWLLGFLCCKLHSTLKKKDA